MSIFSKYKLAAKPDRQDRKDKYKEDRYKLAGPPPLPAESLLSILPPIKDQGQHSSCTGHAVSWFWEQVLTSRGMPWFGLSPLYPWYYARLSEHTNDKDEGVQMRSIMAALNEHGTCPEQYWDHGVDIFREPDDVAKLMAVGKLPVYERCADLQSIKYAIAHEKQAVCIGVLVYPVWYDVGADGLVAYTTKQEAVGGHAVTVAGYSDIRRTLTIANSWGTSYGRGGYIELPYDYLEKDWWDAWTAGFDTIPEAK